MKVYLYLLLAVTPMFGQNNLKTSVSGAVTNSSGDPVSRVKVCSTSYNCALTDTDGRYRMDMFWHNSMRFSHPEYNTVIKTIQSIETDVVLQKLTKESENKRIVQNCADNDNLVGKWFKAIILSKDIIKTNIDYETLWVPSSNNKDVYLRMMWGPNLSSGIPCRITWPLLEEAHVIFFNRDIDYENQMKTEDEIPMDSTIDIKAQAHDGNFWRFFGNAFEVITYQNVPEEIAREFDDIFDTLCYFPPTIKNPQ